MQPMHLHKSHNPHPAASGGGRGRIWRPLAEGCPRIWRPSECRSPVATLTSTHPVTKRCETRSSCGLGLGGGVSGVSQGGGGSKAAVGGGDLWFYSGSGGGAWGQGPVQSTGCAGASLWAHHGDQGFVVVHQPVHRKTTEAIWEGGGGCFSPAQGL